MKFWQKELLITIIHNCLGVSVSAHGRAGQGHYKFFPCSNEVREKIARKKNNGSAAGGGAALELRAERSEAS